LKVFISSIKLLILIVLDKQDDELISMIDPILAADDKNKDGYIDYSEFVQAQQAGSTKTHF
jgi:hypothetical protein